jgi:3-hydroxybutyryl-CoA dehydrogenase
MKISTVGVVGAGVIGNGVAHALAQTGHQVILLDVSEEVLERAKAKLADNLRLYAMFSDERSPKSEILSRIIFSTEYERLNGVSFVIENTTEKWSVKEPVYRNLDAICPKDAVFAVNTSAIPITRLAGLTRRPAQVIGMHFMNPVPLKPMVEIVRGIHTSEETVSRARDLLKQMGKNGIVVNDSPGFVTNRVMMLMINEAIFLLHEQVSSAAEIDLLFIQCFGHKMGPLETADLIGLDTVLLSLEVLYENFNDSKYRPCPLLRKMVDAGFHGCKSGKGFFTHLISPRA